MAKHAHQLLHREAVSEGERCEAVAADVESQALVAIYLFLYEVKIVVGVLVGKFRKLEVPLLQHFHCRRQDRSEELCSRLQTTAVDVVSVANLLRVLLEVEHLGVTIGEPRVGGKNEQIPRLIHFAFQGNVTDDYKFILCESPSRFALATSDRYSVIGIGRNHFRQGEVPHYFLQVLMISVLADIATRPVIKPRVEAMNVTGREVGKGLDLAETFQRTKRTHLMRTGAFADSFFHDELPEVLNEVRFLVNTLVEFLRLGIHLLLLIITVEVGVEVVDHQLKIEDG